MLRLVAMFVLVFASTIPMIIRPPRAGKTQPALNTGQ